MGGFKEGDVVTLKSGGPLMTVKSVGTFTMKGIEDGVVYVWFVENNLKEEVFNAATLDLYHEED